MTGFLSLIPNWLKLSLAAVPASGYVAEKLDRQLSVKNKIERPNK